MDYFNHDIFCRNTDSILSHMKAQIVNIGNELLNGTTLNSNGFWIARELKKHGIETLEITTIKDGSAALKLLQRVRNESHRFAINFQRKLREKSMVTMPWLDEVPGVGKVLSDKVRKKFRTRLGLEKEGFEELEHLIGNAKANAVWDRLEHEKEQESRDVK